MATQVLRIVRVDPYHRFYGLMVPVLAEKLQDALQVMSDLDSVVPSFMARLWGKDPNVLLLAAVDSTGNPRGFAASVFDGAYVTIMQPRLDGPAENDAVGEMIDMTEQWAQSLNSKGVILVTKKLDSKWMKKYGYDVSRYVLRRDFNKD